MSYDGNAHQGSAADEAPPAPKAAKPNPFGAARPREQVIAEREGKKETEVLKEQVQKEWKLSSALSEAQFEEKKAVEAELAYVKSEIEKAVDPIKIKELQEEVAIQEKKLEDLLLSFEKVSVKPARRDRRRDEAGGTDSQDYGGFSRGRPRDNERAAPYPESQEYGSFSRGRGRESERGGAYGDAWGGSKGRSGQPCYACGEVGHFSRECPNNPGGGRGGGNYGGSFGGGGGRSGGGGGGGSRGCYNCGEEGHIARECPKSQGGFGGYGGGGGSYGGYDDSGAGYRSQGGVYDNFGGGR